MEDTRKRAHVVVRLRDVVLLRRVVTDGRPVHSAPGVVVRAGEPPGQAARRAAAESFGLEVEVGDALYADVEHGVEHYWFVARPLLDSVVDPAHLPRDVVPVALAASLAYVTEPAQLGGRLARLVQGG